MSLGKRISLLRKNQGISQEQLAENSRISLRTIQRIESSASVPRPFTVKVIADALGIPIEELTVAQPEDLTQQQNDLETLRLINWSVLVACILPISNIIIPWLIWRKNRNAAIVNIIGGRIVSFQILWTLGTLLITIATHILVSGLTGSVAIGHFPPTLFMVYMILLIVNILFTLRSAIRLSRGETTIYSSIPSLL